MFNLNPSYQYPFNIIYGGSYLDFLAFNKPRIQKKGKNPSFLNLRIFIVIAECTVVSCYCDVLQQLLYIVIFSFSPSGCTFWGKKPWSRKKKILWQLGTLVGAPVGIALIAGIAIPAMITGTPVYQQIVFKMFFFLILRTEEHIED